MTIYKVDNLSKYYHLLDLYTGNIIKSFASYENLIEFLANSQEGLKNKTYYLFEDIPLRKTLFNNKYLDDLNVTLNDSKLIPFTEEKYFLRQYVFIDSFSRIIDVREFYKDIIKKEPFIKRYICKHYSYIHRMRKNVGNHYNGAKFRKEPIPYINNSFSFCSYRTDRTYRILKYNCFLEVEGYVRPKRKTRLIRKNTRRRQRLDKSWKNQSKKRKQWMK